MRRFIPAIPEYSHVGVELCFVNSDLCKAGSVALWDGRVWHGNGPRTIDGERAVLHVTYTRLAMRQMETYPRSVEDQVIER